LFGLGRRRVNAGGRCRGAPALSVDARGQLVQHARDNGPQVVTRHGKEIVHGLTLVTRNTADIERTGVGLLNPFEPAR
jgi:hypothetical protein